MAVVYEINKGINRSLEFKGIKAQYITYLAIGMVALLLLFAILYMCHLKIYYCLGTVLPAGAALVITIRRCSSKYGENGFQKSMASKKLPSALRCRSRQFFLQLSTPRHEEK